VGDMSSEITSAEAATLLSVSQRTVQRWAATGRIEHTRTPGGHLLLPRGVQAPDLPRGRPKEDARARSRRQS
jgi:excisionase family DNA binding protein